MAWTNENVNSDTLHELLMLRHEYRAAMSVTCDPEERFRLYRLVNELTTSIDRLQANSTH